MTLYNKTTNKVELYSTILNTALATTSNYTIITLKTKLVGGTYVETNMLTSSNWLWNSTTVFLNPILFGMATSTTTIVDGIYEMVLITTSTTGEILTEQLCVLIDNNTACLATTDDKILKYLILKETYNCTCDCTKLDTIYKNIIEDDTSGCNCQ
jgi:hypothetical protein